MTDQKPLPQFPRPCRTPDGATGLCHGFFTSTRDDAGLRTAYVAAIFEYPGGGIREMPATWIQFTE